MFSEIDPAEAIGLVSFCLFYVVIVTLTTIALIDACEVRGRLAIVAFWFGVLVLLVFAGLGAALLLGRF